MERPSYSYGYCWKLCLTSAKGQFKPCLPQYEERETPSHVTFPFLWQTVLMIKHDGDRSFRSYRITWNFYHYSKNGIRQLKEPGRIFFDIKDRAWENKGIHPTALKRNAVLSSRKWDWRALQASKGTCQKLKLGFNACSEKSESLAIFSISLVHMIEQMEERF